MPLPGEVSLAHHGVCLLDELPECRRHVLEVWRPPLENGLVTIAQSLDVGYIYIPRIENCLFRNVFADFPRAA